MVTNTARNDRDAGARSTPARRPAPVDASFGFLDYVRILHRRRWPGLIAFFVIALPPLVLTMTAEAVYEGQARVQVGIPLPDVAGRETPQTKGTVNDYVELFKSRRVARSALEELRLWNPPFERSTNLVLRLRDVLGQLWPGEATASAATVRDTSEPESLRGPIDALLANLTVTPVPESRLLDISVSATDPVVAAKLTNAIVRHGINQDLGLRASSNQETSQWLSRQLAEQRQRLEASEAALQQYKEEKNALSVGDRQNIVDQKLIDLNSALTRAKTERIAKEELYKRAQTLRASPSDLDTLPGAAGSTYVRQLKDEIAALTRKRTELSEQYGELHPEMVAVNNGIKDAKARLDAELAKIGDSVRNEYLAAAAQERSLTAALEAQKGEALDLNRKTIEYGALERDALGNRALYERLLQQSQQTGLSSALKAADMAIVDAAEPPPIPARPARGRNAIASIGGALFGAIGFALLLEFLDKRIKSPDQIKRDLALPYLGYVPLVRSDASSEPLLIDDDISASFHEAVRRVRANLMLSTATEGCRLLVVTSTAPREGKTMVSSNLALALSQSGARVLLVDADLRRPRIEEQLRLDAGPGLSDVLTGQRTLDAALRSLKGTALAILTAGPCPPNPPELISSARYRDLMSSLRDKYDWIIVDSPPVMAVADAALLAREATGVIFVVGAEMSSIETVREAVDELGAANATILGAVLNRVDLERNGFYYSKYYNPDYEHYYRR